MILNFVAQHSLGPAEVVLSPPDYVTVILHTRSSRREDRPMVITSEFPPVEVLDVPIHDAVLGRAQEYGDRPAWWTASPASEISYAQLDGMSRRVAAGFAELGIVHGDMVALYSPNTILYPVVFYGATRAGATVTTVNALYTADELHKQLVDSKAKLLVTISLFLPVATAAVEGTDVQEILVCDQAEGYRSVQELIASTAPEPVVDDRPGRGRRGAAVLERHDRRGQGRDADASQHRDQHHPGRGRPSRWARASGSSRSCRSSTSTG